MDLLLGNSGRSLKDMLVIDGRVGNFKRNYFRNGIPIKTYAGKLVTRDGVMEHDDHLLKYLETYLIDQFPAGKDVREVVEQNLLKPIANAYSMFESSAMKNQQALVKRKTPKNSFLFGQNANNPGMKAGLAAGAPVEKN